jgi:hypothetical protein
MIFLKYFLASCFILVAFILNSIAQELPATMEEWQKRMDELTAKKYELTGKVYDTMKDIESLKITKKNNDSIYEQTQMEIYRMVDADKSQLVEFKDRFDATESKILNDASTLSDIKEYWYDWIIKSKIRLLKEYRTRFTVMKDKVENWKGK